LGKGGKGQKQHDFGSFFEQKKKREILESLGEKKHRPHDVPLVQKGGKGKSPLSVKKEGGKRGKKKKPSTSTPGPGPDEKKS